jgi:hypothetical protein
MDVKIEKKGKKDVLIITAEIEERPSKSGKSTVVFSSNGNQPTTTEYKGKQLIVGVNAYYK